MPCDDEEGKRKEKRGESEKREGLVADIIGHVKVQLYEEVCRALSVLQSIAVESVYYYPIILNRYLHQINNSSHAM